MKRNGFTLIELLAVIAILAILIIMAVPAVLKTFNKSRKSTFNNELNTIIKAARYQYVLDGEPTTYDNNSNPLRVSNKSDFDYCITVNADGEVIDFKATNGSYKYESNGSVEETKSGDIEDAESGYTPSCMPANALTIQYVNRQNAGQITAGDEVSMGSEHFYVVSSNSTNTVLLAKYNLLVGDVFERIDGTWTFTTLSSSDPGYGLQSERAKGEYGSSTDRTAVVAFSGKGYWDNANCVWNGTSNGDICSGTAGLKSEYANSVNAAGKTGAYTSPYPYVYNSSMSSIAPSYGIYTNSSSTWRGAYDNGYTIAYYVEGYVNRLKSLGASNNITGRLLTYEEASSLSSTVKGNWSYWLGNAGRSDYVGNVYSGIINNAGNYWYDYVIGVRPVIEIPTSLMPN